MSQNLNLSLPTAVPSCQRTVMFLLARTPQSRSPSLAGVFYQVPCQRIHIDLFSLLIPWYLGNSVLAFLSIKTIGLLSKDTLHLLLLVILHWNHFYSVHISYSTKPVNLQKCRDTSMLSQKVIGLGELTCKTSSWLFYFYCVFMRTATQGNSTLQRSSWIYFFVVIFFLLFGLYHFPVIHSSFIHSK